VFAVPGPIDAPNSAGCHRLIREGAILATCAGDILSEYESRFPHKLRRTAPPMPPLPRMAGEPKTAEEKRKPAPKSEEYPYTPEAEQTPVLPRLTAEEWAALSTEQQTVLQVLRTDEPKLSDQLAEDSGLPIQRVLPALTLLEIAESEGRKFALIHFSGPGRFQTDRFLPKQATVEDKLRAAETFLDGGTDFCTPMNEALRLMQEEGFDNADIVFITDGECLLPEEYISNLQKEQSARRFTITGILLDQGNAGMDFSLNEFCQNTYRVSKLDRDAIVQSLVNTL